MNQILQEKGYTPKSNNNKQNVKDIILYLIILLIIFGLIFGGYLIYKHIANRSTQNTPDTGNNITEEPEYITEITLQKEGRNKVVLKINSEIELSNMRYSWNNESPNTIDITGKTNIEKTLEIPVGENTIYVLVTDINGKETKKQETFVVESPKPEIDLSIVGNYIKISITSEIEIAEIKYNWNLEAEKIENMTTYVDRKNFEKKIEIPIGKNTLKIVAIDINGNKAEKSQEIKGVTKATTTTQAMDGYLHFTVTGNENIKTVEFEFNGNKYLMNTDTFGKTKTVHYKVKLIEGNNYLKITSTTESGGVDTTTWQHKHTKE